MSSRRLLIVCTVATLLVLAECASTGGPTTDEPTLTPTETPPTTTQTLQEILTATTQTTQETVPITTQQTTTTANGTLEVHFINMDQSVSMLVIGPTGETMFIDTGDFNDDGDPVLQYATS